MPLQSLAPLWIACLVARPGLATTGEQPAEPPSPRANGPAMLDTGQGPAPVATPADALIQPPATTEATEPDGRGSADLTPEPVVTLTAPGSATFIPGAIDSSSGEASRHLGLPGPAGGALGSEDRGGSRGLQPRWKGGTEEMLRVGGALAVVLGLLLILRVMLRRGALRTAGGRPSGVVEILARYPVGRGQHLVLLKLARRVLLVHHAGSSMTTLTELIDPDEVGALLGRLESGASGRGAGWFRSTLRRYEQEHEQVERSLPAAGLAPGSGEVIDLTRRRRRPRHARGRGRVVA